jgi:peptidoglycan/LPS O-acetylase OafA/YrhL
LLDWFSLIGGNPKALVILWAFCWGLVILLQVAGPQVSFLNAWLANYPYPVNSFSLYFFLGMILFFYQDQLRNIFQKKFMPWLIAGLLLFYSPIFLKNFYVNAYNSYQHLPWLLLTTSLIGVFFFFTWEKIKLPVVLDWPIKKTASALLYIYVLHYIIFFGYLADKNWSYAKLSLAILVIIIVAIVLKSLVDKCRQRLFRATIKQ